MIRRLSLLAVVLVLQACGGSPAKVLPPAELTALKNEFNIETVWSKKLGDGVSDNFLRLHPVVQGQRGYAAEYRGLVRAFDPETGKTYWQVDLHMPISAGLTLEENKLFLGNSRGEVVALNPDDGTILWRSQLSSEVLATPVLAKGKVIAKTVDGHVFALNSSDGKQLWSYESTVPLLTLRGSSAPVVVNDIVISAFDNGRVVAMTLNDGKALWETTIAVAHGRNEIERIIDIDADPLVLEDIVYVVSYQGRIAALQLGSGQQIWTRDFSSYSGMQVDAYRLYVTDSEGQLWALNRYNGSTLWRQDKLLRRALTAPALQDQYVVVADYDGYLHWIGRDDGKLKARQRLHWLYFDEQDYDAATRAHFSRWNNILVTPIVDNHSVLAFDRQGHLETLRIQNK